MTALTLISAAHVTLCTNQAWINMCVLLHDSAATSRSISIISMYLTIAYNCSGMRPHVQTYDHVCGHTSTHTVRASACVQTRMCAVWVRHLVLNHWVLKLGSVGHDSSRLESKPDYYYRYYLLHNILTWQLWHHTVQHVKSKGLETSDELIPQRTQVNQTAKGKKILRINYGYEWFCEQFIHLKHAVE